MTQNRCDPRISMTLASESNAAKIRKMDAKRTAANKVSVPRVATNGCPVCPKVARDITPITIKPTAPVLNA